MYYSIIRYTFVRDYRETLAANGLAFSIFSFNGPSTNLGAPSTLMPQVYSIYCVQNAG